MRAENPAALKFILQDDIFLLPADKEMIRSGADQPVAEIAPEPAETSILPVIEAPAQPVIEEAVAPVAETPALPAPEPIVEIIKEQVIETPVVTFNYLGDFKKQFLIFTHYPSQQHIAGAHLTALQSILKRKEFEAADIAIYNLANNAVTDMLSLAKQFKPTRVLVLGRAAIPAGLESLALNQLKQFKTFNALYSHSFDEMMDNVEYKKAFWEQMKNL